MAEPLSGRTAIVTGAGRGIGRACARRLARLGADVAVLDVDLRSGDRYTGEPRDTPEEEIIRLGRRAIGLHADVTVEAEVREAIDAVLEEWQRIDVLINAAGGAVTPYHQSSPSAASAADVQRLIDLNVLSVVHSCQAVASAMRRHGRGAIVNIASVAAFGVLPGGRNAGYAAAKAALVHWTRHLAADLGPDGIRVNAIAPGITLTGRVVAESAQTGFADRAHEVPLRRLGTPEDCADVVEFLVGDLAAFVTGQCVVVDGGWSLSRG